MPRSVNILYLSYDGITDPLGQSQVLPYLNKFAKLGNQINLVSFEKFDIRVAHNGLDSTINWIPCRYQKNPPILSTIFGLRLMFAVCKKLLYTQQVEIIHVRSYLPMLAALSLKRKYGCELIFDMRGFWPDERIEGGIWNIKNPIYRLLYKYFKKKEKEFLEASDHVVSLTHNGANELITKFNVSKDKISVIPTAVDNILFDSEKIKHEDQISLRQKIGVNPNDFILLYFGSLGTWYLLDEMLDYFIELKKSVPEAKFLFVTKDLDVIKTKIKNCPEDLAGSILITQGSREEMPNFIKMASASIFFIKPSYSKKASNATKMGESLAMNKPIITNSGWGDVDKILKNKSLGVLVKSLSKGSYQNSIDQLLQSDWSSNSRRDYALNNLSLEEAVKKYDQIYQSLLSSATSPLPHEAPESAS